MYRTGVICGWLVLSLGSFAATAAEEQGKKPKVEVCFVLDTTGSMGGLIQGAKDKIWSIANEIVSGKPTPEVRMGLVGYRDRGDEYVTRISDLTNDLDEIYGKLTAFQAQGGGDSPESVNQALFEAVTKMTWSAGKDVLKIVFLVGDCPPHMDYQDDVKYPEICQQAMKRELVINTIQCGTDEATTPIWQEIARKAEGEYAAILQDGGTVAMATPFDADIARLNRDLSATVVGYGDAVAQGRVESRLGTVAGAKAESIADRAGFLMKTKAAPAAPAKVISGDEDLISLVGEGKVKLDAVDAKQLPAELQKLSPAEQKAAIEAKAQQRKELNAQMEELVKKRSSYVEEERKRMAKEGKKDGFDEKVKDMLRKQAAAKGIK